MYREQLIEALADSPTFYRNRQADIRAALEFATTMLVDCLTNDELTQERRQQLTQASNAAELALHCVLNGGPREPFTIGF